MKRIEFDLEIDGDEPVYVQLISYYKMLLARGDISDGDELPSRRELALRLAINPNTVQRAYKELEDANMIVTSANAKSVAKVTDLVVWAVRAELTETYTCAYIEKMCGLRYGAEESAAIVKKIWSKSGKNDLITKERE